jgi:iron transport multicopper oxidase
MYISFHSLPFAQSSRYHVLAPDALVIGQLPPFSVSTLINGKGRYKDGPAVPLSAITVTRFKRYRFRIIAMACDPAFTFSIDQHPMTIIEADGEYTVPHVVDSLEIFAGQRYSVVVIADRPIDNYWIRAEPNRGDTGFAGGINMAILRYIGAPSSDPSTDPAIAPPRLLPFNEVDLHAFQKPSQRVPGKPFPGGADVVLNLAHAFDFNTFQYKMNGVAWVPPTVPVLLQILSGAQAAQDLLPSGSVYSLPPNKVIEISLPGTGINQGGPVRNQGSVRF